uniref:Uncharacterized protein n=1 Tax=Arundo donax TaxID=35708 RepID=A0A0A9E0L7_ARUDO
MSSNTLFLNQGINFVWFIFVALWPYFAATLVKLKC